MPSVVHTGADPTKLERYQQICTELGELLASEADLIANAANASALLFHSIPNINWLGFYFARHEQLVLGPFHGRPACTRIPFGKGVCGVAASQGKTIVVPDVNLFPGHIACDTASRSEIVVRLLNWGKLLGVLDGDSASPNRFDDDDRDGFESIASVFVSSLATNDLPDFVDAARF